MKSKLLRFGDAFCVEDGNFALRVPPKNLSNMARVTKSDTPTLSKIAPVTKNYIPTSLQLHETLRLPRKVPATSRRAPLRFYLTGVFTPAYAANFCATAFVATPKVIPCNITKYCPQIDTKTHMPTTHEIFLLVPSRPLVSTLFFSFVFFSSLLYPFPLCPSLLHSSLLYPSTLFYSSLLFSLIFKQSVIRKFLIQFFLKNIELQFLQLHIFCRLHIQINCAKI